MCTFTQSKLRPHSRGQWPTLNVPYSYFIVIYIKYIENFIPTSTVTFNESTYVGGSLLSAPIKPLLLDDFHSKIIKSYINANSL